MNDVTSRNRKFKPRHAPPRPSRLTVAQSVDFSRSLLAAGKFADAEKVLDSLVAASPDHADVLHLMGALRNLQGRSTEALVLLERAVLLMPDEPARLNDIGIVFVRLKRVSDAVASLERCVALSAGNPLLAARAHENIGRLQLKDDALVAERSFRLATELAPKFALGWYGLSEALIRQMRIAEGVDAWGKATVLMPKSASREHVARALVHLGETAEAIKHYRAWQKEEPNNPVIKHHIAALTKPDTAERASDAYVEAVFDQFAASFDSQLALLEYHAPELITDAVKAIYPQATATLDIADAGCGTGLCGPLVLPWARRLCGFDLSGGMLAQAEARKVYTDLHKVELVSFLNAHPGEFDVIISADTLCYFGDLHEVMAACALAVRAGGHIFYTVEASRDDAAPIHDHVEKIAIIALAYHHIAGLDFDFHHAHEHRLQVGWRHHLEGAHLQ